MKILVVGGGGREHALCWKLKQSPLVSGLFCCPGNRCIAQIAECIEGDAVEAAKTIGVDFVVVGPEVPLAAGIVDELAAIGISAFGPNEQAARLEASKIFCKDLLRKYSIPTGGYETFDDVESARAYLSDYDAESAVVVKADGLAAGKGVVVAGNPAAAIAALDEIGAIGGRVLVEEFLDGPEVSLIVLTDGETAVPLVAAQDHKRVFEGDEGPNTGGMGCYSPVPVFPDWLRDEVMETIIRPTVAALKSEGIEYRGALYAGLMLTASGPKVLEYNCRFGDPETEVILPRLQSDLLPLLLASARVEGYELAKQECEWTPDAAVCVVMAAHNYPATPRKGDAISGLEASQTNGAIVFHAGTSKRENEIVTSGGRVLCVSALGENFQQARENVYDAVGKIHFDGAHFRRDIGWRCVE